MSILLKAYLLIFSLSLASALYSKSSPVQLLDAPAFHNKVRNGNDIWLVEFFAPWCGHCKSFAPEYEKAAKALEGIVKVVGVQDESVMASEAIQGFPTVQLYLGKGTSPVQFKEARTAQSVVEFVLKQLSSVARNKLNKGSSKSENSKSSSNVIEITDANFDEIVMKDHQSVWFIEFYAPWCGHCKALASTWEEVASTLKGKVKIAKIDATTNAASAARFSVKGYPSLTLLPSGKKSVGAAVPYHGPRELESLVHFAIGFAGDSLEASQLLSNDQFTDECNKGVCIISFLPHLLDSGAKGRKNYLKQLNEAVKSSVSMPVKFFWVQGGDNYEIEESLRLQFGWPAVIATRVDKQKYAILKGDFSSESIRSFLTGLMSGRQALSALPQNLKTFSTAAKWDGKDAAPSRDEEL